MSEPSPQSHKTLNDAMKSTEAGSLETVGQPKTWQNKDRTGVTASGSTASAQATPQNWPLDAARAELRTKDPVIRGLIDANPDLDHHAWRATLPVQGLFEALLFQIVGQQISVAAGNAIFARLRALYSADHDPATLAKRSIDELRATGLSTRKAEYVKDLARRAEAGELVGLEHLPHEEARTLLTSFRGIGPWTADGALFIAFGGDDVLVSGDLVLRKAVQRAYNLPAMPSEKDVETIGEQWRPYRSIAAVYLFECMVSV